MNEKDKLEALLLKYHKGLCSKEELELLEQWLNELEQATSNGLVFNNEEERRQLQTSMRKNIHDGLQTPSARPVRKLWVSLLKTAAVLLIIASAGYYFISVRKDQSQFSAQNNLSAWDTIYTEQGKIKKVVLPDQSTMFLSANSKIRVSANFSKTNRQLELISGEAWFDVVKNPDLPFTVKSGKLQTTVLGTQFMVTAYLESDKIEVNVTRGKVKVGDDKQTQNLIPGQAVRYSPNTGTMDMKPLSVTFDPENQRYLLTGCSFKELSMRIEDIFGYKLVPASAKVTERNYTGEISLNKSINAVISKFLEIHHYGFEIKGKEVHIK